MQHNKMEEYTPILKTLTQKFAKYAYILFETKKGNEIVIQPVCNEWCDDVYKLIKKINF